MTAPVLEVCDLHVDFDLADSEIHAVRGLSFSLHAGQRLGMVGESGCGKSTAALAIMGLLPPNASVAGRVLLDGVDILAGGEATMRPHRWSDVAMVFQGAMNSFNPVRTIGEQIAEPMRLHLELGRRQARARVGELLDMVGLPADRATRYPHEFSGGMRQRAALAMALACGPKVLLADEPTTALDTIVAAEILGLLRRVTDELGVALVFISHDLPAVGQVANRVAVMYAGRVVEDASVTNLFATPQHPYTSALLDAIPDPWLVDATQPGRRVVSIRGEPPKLNGAVRGCPFAPRCDFVADVCHTTEPALAAVGDTVAACHVRPLVGVAR